MHNSQVCLVVYELNILNDSNLPGHLTAKSDVYGFGVVLLELIVGKRAMDKHTPNQEHNLVDWAHPILIRTSKLLKIIDPKMQGQYSCRTASNVANLAHRCLSRNPKLRPSMKEVVELLETYNSEEILYQSKKAAGTLEEDTEETFGSPAGQRPLRSESRRAGCGSMETIGHGSRRMKQGRIRSDPSPKEFDHRHCPSLDSDAQTARSRPSPDNYER